MKLYATTTSERASKGQGGNKSLVIDIKAQELEGIPTRQNLFRISMEVEDKRLTAKIWDYSEGDEILLYPRHASEPPKGQKCEHCKAITKTSQQYWHCANCGTDN
jgi:hypothetical protein